MTTTRLNPSLCLATVLASALLLTSSADAQVHALSSSTRPTTEPRDAEGSLNPRQIELPTEMADRPASQQRQNSIELVGFDDDDDFSVFVQRPGQDRATPLCPQVPCSRDLTPGRYTLSAGDGDDHVLVGEPIDITRSGRIQIDYRPQHKKRRRMGFATLVFGGVGAAALGYAMRQDVRPQKMMLTGGVLLGIGFATLMSALFSRDRIDVTYLPE